MLLDLTEEEIQTLSILLATLLTSKEFKEKEANMPVDAKIIKNILNKLLKLPAN